MSPSCSGNFVVDYSIPEQVMMQSKLMKSRGISFHLFAESTVLSAASQRATIKWCVNFPSPKHEPLSMNYPLCVRLRTSMKLASKTI